MSEMRTWKDLTYARASGKELLLDLYLPAKGMGLLLVVVWIHSGAFRF